MKNKKLLVKGVLIFFLLLIAFLAYLTFMPIMLLITTYLVQFAIMMIELAISLVTIRLAVFLILVAANKRKIVIPTKILKMLKLQ